jgi:hypothetical protein
LGHFDCLASSVEHSLESSLSFVTLGSVNNARRGHDE